MADDHRSDDTGATVIQLERPGEPVPSAGPPDPDPDAAVVLVDQRMHQRRVAVLRAAGQRRLTRLLWGLGPLAALVTAAAVVHTPMLDVDRIVIDGVVLTPPATVGWASGIERGDTLATLDEHGAERRIERLPWVDDADVIREWPGTARIVVTERQPAAVVHGDEDRAPAIVDREARVLDIGGQAPEGLIGVTGLDAGLGEGGDLPSAARPALELAVALDERLPGVVAAVDLDLDASLATGGIVRFGSLDELEDKLVALQAFVSDVDLGGLAVLDLRVPTSPTVRRGG
jgi:cell division septal protein FtsQ